MKKYLEVIRYEDDAVVKRIDVTGQSQHNIDKLDRGLNINLNHSEYYTSEREYTTEQKLD